jgi:hypothetical protein
MSGCVFCRLLSNVRQGDQYANPACSQKFIWEVLMPNTFTMVIDKYFPNKPLKFLQT